MRAISFVLFAALLPGAEFLPLEKGNQWTYRSVETGETMTIRVSEPVALHSGRVYHFVRGFEDGVRMLRIDEAGNLMQYDEETEQESLLAGFSAPAGELWTAPRRACQPEGETGAERVAAEGPAGRWGQALELRYYYGTCAGPGAASELYVENIGMVRRIVNTLDGLRTYELIHARVGNVTVESRDRGRFTVNVEPEASGEAWLVTLRLDLGSAGAMRLRFASGQEYDVAVRDAEGNALWTWSDGQFFDQALHEKELGNQWSVTVRVPKAEGAAFIEGWLTTAPGSARFAAAAPAPQS